MMFGVEFIGRPGVVTPPLDGTSWRTQVHGAAVAVIGSTDEQQGSVADALVTSLPNRRLMIRTADCAPILLRGLRNDIGVGVGVVHAGWRGLLAGIVPAAVGALRGFGAEQVEASLYPCIGPECYEFGDEDLQAMTTAFGSAVAGHCASGSPSLDVAAALDASLALCGVEPADRTNWRCTACHRESLFSHRARGDTGRMGLVAWLEPTP